MIKMETETPAPDMPDTPETPEEDGMTEPSETV